LRRLSKSRVVDVFVTVAVFVWLGELALLVTTDPADAVDDPIQNAKHFTLLSDLAMAADDACDAATLLSFHTVTPFLYVVNEQSPKVHPGGYVSACTACTHCIDVKVPPIHANNMTSDDSWLVLLAVVIRFRQLICAYFGHNTCPAIVPSILPPIWPIIGAVKPPECVAIAPAAATHAPCTTGFGAGGWLVVSGVIVCGGVDRLVSGVVGWLLDPELSLLSLPLLSLLPVLLLDPELSLLSVLLLSLLDPAIPPKPIVLTNGIILLSMPFIFLFPPTFFGCCCRFVVNTVYVFATIATKISFNCPPNIPVPRNIATLIVDFLYYWFRQSDP
jgi:hypothetical protein